MSISTIFQVNSIILKGNQSSQLTMLYLLPNISQIQHQSDMSDISLAQGNVVMDLDELFLALG